MKKFFMAVIAFMMTISASAQFYIYFSNGTVAKVDSISMVAPADAEDPTNPDNPSTPSQSIGVFSVSATKQVTFSPGNLQYTQPTNTWSFAENQYDYLGEANIAISADLLADKIDLFGWSTSASYFGVTSSANDDDYSGSFVDWGTNKIGNDAPNTWRTLTYDEWEYLLNTRPNAITLKGVAQVNGVNGLILLPDNWTRPAGVTFKWGFHSSYGKEYYAAYQTITKEQWSKLESAGAVFLPAAVSRTVLYVDVNYMQYYGNYWSATETESASDGAHYLYFDSTYADVLNHGRYYGLSVRLVKDL